MFTKNAYFYLKFSRFATETEKKMKRLPYIGILLTIFMSVSCGEDRSGEFYALIEDRIWIEETMRCVGFQSFIFILKIGLGCLSFIFTLYSLLFYL